MKVEIITPDGPVFSGEASSVKLPGADGGLEILTDHAPMVNILAKGELSIATTEGLKTMTVDGGTVEVSNNNVTVLAEAIIEA